MCSRFRWPSQAAVLHQDGHKGSSFDHPRHWAPEKHAEHTKRADLFLFKRIRPLLRHASLGFGTGEADLEINI